MACTIDSLDVASIVSDLDPTHACGSTQIPMGLGELGDGRLIWKRKFRWTFELQYCCSSATPQTVAREFVKAGARPQINFDEVEINYLNGVTWIPGKGKWGEMNVTYYDVAGNATNTGGVNTNSILSWLATIYNFTDPVCLTMNSVPQDYEGIARLVMWDGCGNPLEGWILRHVWPKTVDWGDLSAEDNGECNIQLTLRYSSVSFQSFCPGGSITPCPCSACPT